MDDRAESGGAALFAAVRSALAAQRDGPPLERVPRDSPAPASFAQEGLWFLEQRIPGSSIHNLTVAYRMVGRLCASALEQSLAEMLRRHEILRTTLRKVGGRLVQHIHDDPGFTLTTIDLTQVDAGVREEQAERRIAEDARTPFEPQQVPLMRATLIALHEREHLLALTVHHIAFDGWSFEVFMRETCELYHAFVEGRPSPLVDPPLQYADVAIWQRRRLDGERLAPLLQYWRTQLRGPLPVLKLPFDRPRRRDQTRRGAYLSRRLPRDLTAGAKRLSAEAGATANMTLFAAFNALLHRYTGEDDIVIGSPVANRNRAELEGLVGLFINTLALRTRLERQLPFRDLLDRVRQVVVDAYAHQDLPFETLVQSLDLARRGDASPVFRIMFAYQNLPRSGWSFPGVEVDAWNVENGTVMFDITLFLQEVDEEISVLLEYDTELFDEGTMTQLLDNYETLLAAIVHDPDTRLGDLPLLSPADMRRVVDDWNATAVAYPRDATIHQLFARQARRSPKTTALASDAGDLTYCELDRRANRLARYLRDRGVGHETLVAVCLDPSPERIVTLLAILAAGGAYVPIDPEAPQRRIREVLERAGIEIVVTQNAYADRVAPAKMLIKLDRHREDIDRESGVALAPAGDGSSLAYVMFTSGSTGVPKGVCIPHRGVVRLVTATNHVDIGADDVLLQLAPITFDAASFEIWGALLNGAKLVIPSVRHPSLAEIGAAIQRHRTSIVWLTTRLFQLMVDERLADITQIPRHVLVGGEVLSVPHVARFLRESRACLLTNLYGPTENTTFSTFFPVVSVPTGQGDTIPIGRPIANSLAYVLDADRRPLPPGVVGELYVGGDGLMRGYLDDDAATHDRLVPSPFRPGTALYRTGDLARRHRDGNLEFVGRCDDQVKIRGFRVEPSEVAVVLGECPQVQSVVVHAVDSGPEGPRLVAYAVPRSAATATSTTTATREYVAYLRGFARERLPDYLVPAAFVVVEAIPLNSNGKLDREALVALGGDAPPAPDVVPPRGEYERTVAEAFEQVLEFADIGREHDFFECGGSSLSALRLVAILEKQLNVQLTLAGLFQHSTVAQFAEFVRDRCRGAKAAHNTSSTLVPIREGRLAPLFLVPGGHGGMIEMTLYAKLLSHVDDLTVYGLLARGVDGTEEPHSSVLEMATDYVTEIRRVQPRGPYAIGGECVGGVIAFEMARQLRIAGEEVAMLLLMDSWCPTARGARRYRFFYRPLTILKDRAKLALAGLSHMRILLREHVRARPPFGPISWLRYAASVMFNLARNVGPHFAAIRRVGQPEPGGERIAVAEANYIDVVMRHRPAKYAGAVTMLVTEKSTELGLVDSWRRVIIGEPVVLRVPGDHETYIRDTPQVTAERLRLAIGTRLAAGAAG